MGIFESIARSVNRLTHSAGVRVYVNHTYARYGKMTELKIDEKAKTIDATVELKGEEGAIHVHVGGYVLDAEGGTLTVGEVRVSREWMDALANQLLKGKAVPLPAGAVKWLKMVL